MKGCFYCGKGRDKRHGGKQYLLVSLVDTKEVIKVCSQEHFWRVINLYDKVCEMLG